MISSDMLPEIDELREVVAAIRRKVRSYDVIVRFGGDEFVCRIMDLTLEEAAERFSLVKADLAQTQQASVTVGLAQLVDDDSLDDLIARAEDNMDRARQQRARRP